MKAHAILSGDIKTAHLIMLDLVRRIVNNDIPNGATCHVVCETIAKEFPSTLRHVRGKFNHCKHSWLEFSDGVILDPYPWACGSGPLLIVGHAMMWRSIYVEEEKK